MIHSSLIKPSSIAIIGGSQNTAKPGGKIIENLLKSPFTGELFVVNPKEDKVQGLKSYHSIGEAPVADLAILAIPARFCPDAILELCQKGTRSFIVISAGFGELDEKGKLLDKQILSILEEFGASLLGPNCIGLINNYHHSVFTTPVPPQDEQGIEFISSSGSTAVFVMEAGMKMGLTFSNIYTVGNALQISVEDLLEHLDHTYDHNSGSKVKMIYIENVGHPQKFIRHARSLRQKGAHIVALKAGTTEAGGRAASSHTGAMASPAVAIEAMFRKAGVIQCYSRQEMLYAAAILQCGLPKGRNIAVVTHAGGAGVMLTDALEKGGLQVPEIAGAKADELLNELYPGSSVKNPIDFLATGTAVQLGRILDYCDESFDQIDGIAVIFGSPGLFDVREVYDLLDQRIGKTRKPIYPILPSPVNTAEAINHFVGMGNLFFPDESIFGQVLCKVVNGPGIPEENNIQHEMDHKKIRDIIEKNPGQYLRPSQLKEILEAARIPVVPENYASTETEMTEWFRRMEKPLVMKVVGPVHKSDLGGVILDINSESQARDGFKKLMAIKGAKNVLIQPMVKGLELFIGAKKEEGFGHLVLFGMGGIFLEVLKDVQSLLAPVSREELVRAAAQLKSFAILKGIRGQKGIDLEQYYSIIQKIAQLASIAPEILEMDLNPLIASGDSLIVVDGRIRVGGRIV